VALVEGTTGVVDVVDTVVAYLEEGILVGMDSLVFVVVPFVVVVEGTESLVGKPAVVVVASLVEVVEFEHHLAAVALLLKLFLKEQEQHCYSYQKLWELLESW